MVCITHHYHHHHHASPLPSSGSGDGSGDGDGGGNGDGSGSVDGSNIRNNSNGGRGGLGIANGIISASGAAANYLAPKAPIQHPTISVISTLATISRFGNTFACAGLATKLFKKPRAAEARIDTIIMSALAACTILHLAELNDTTHEDKAVSIVDECGDIGSYISGISYMMAVTDPKPTTKTAAIVTLVVSNLVQAGLHVTQGIMVGT
ncbi:hypothetical protein H072_2902 [Dactylellina haptotyla CBS 200.50]|uniref:Uncharacterized protein n=1 Tax=Dactylellina haptotyla (strain CBS 200.50) TaxID=1284197 RepID=S8AJK0_DACHA|nr:hypothetical protein H072_2902 [Dactylellina haptotyla CBS 200.50]